MSASLMPPSESLRYVAPAAKAFFDSNILLYAVSEGDPRAETASHLLATGGCLSVQVLNEFSSIARGKFRKPWEDIRKKLRDIRALCDTPLPLTVGTHESAVAIADRYGYNIYDALILASALEAGCDVLYSEDMQDGQRIDGLTIRNPFL